MRRISTATNATQDIHTALSAVVYTADADREIDIELLAEGLAGGGSYTTYWTRRRLGTGTIFQSAPTTYVLGATTYTLRATSGRMPVKNTDVITMYILGLTGDTAVTLTPEVWDTGMAVDATGQVTVGAIAAGAITAASIAAGALTSTAFAAGAITSTAIATGAVTSGAYAAGAITASAIAAGAITASTFAANAIAAAGIATGALTSTKFAAGALTSSAFAAGAVNAAAVASDANQAIADALLDRTNGVETSYTVRQVLRLMAAVMLGKSPTDGSIFRDLGDSKNRVTATVDSQGKRVGVAYDAS